MRHYIVFYNNSRSGELVGACGDRSVIRLDGRERFDHGFAKEQCQKRGYAAYRHERGCSLLDLQPIGKMVRI